MALTTDILLSTEITQLQSAYDTAIVRDQNLEGAWSDVYDLLYGFLTTTNLGVETYRTDVPVDPDVWLCHRACQGVIFRHRCATCICCCRELEPR